MKTRYASQKRILIEVLLLNGIIIITIYGFITTELRKVFQKNFYVFYRGGYKFNFEDN